MNPLYGNFVCSSANDYGLGKLQEFDENSVTIEYFDSPLELHRVSEVVSAASVRMSTLQPQTRVYFYDGQAGFWRMGRVDAHVENVQSEDGVQDIVYVALPNKKQAVVRGTEVFVRWDRPLSNPWAHLEARLTETPFFHSARSELVAELTKQRTASSGMTALLSAPIELERHQIEVVHRILTDPVQRYLLADEVGLGKTIEAGIILRQHLLDASDSHSALIVVPEGLVYNGSGNFRSGVK